MRKRLFQMHFVSYDTIKNNPNQKHTLGSFCLISSLPLIKQTEVKSDFV